jgi:hypothetical protein
MTFPLQMAALSLGILAEEKVTEISRVASAGTANDQLLSVTDQAAQVYGILHTWPKYIRTEYCNCHVRYIYVINP